MLDQFTSAGAEVPLAAALGSVADIDFGLVFHVDISDSWLSIFHQSIVLMFKISMRILLLIMRVGVSEMFFF